MKQSLTARASSAAMVAMIVSVWLAPAAHAQLIGDTTDAVGNTVGGATDVVKDVSDGLEGGTDGSGADEETSGGSNPGPIEQIVETVDKTVESGKEQINETTSQASDTVNQIGSDAGSVVTGTVDSVSESLPGTEGDKKRKGSGDWVGGRVSSPTSNAYSPEVLGNSFASAMRADGQKIATAKTEGRYAIASATESTGQGLIAQIGRIAAEAVKQAVFPALLIALVMGFLMVQNRVDRKDPKLALAPVDSEHDLLSFT